MGDKSPKSKQRDKEQKSAAKANTKDAQTKRQNAMAPQVPQDKRK